jgi:hypothetical protein
MINMIVLSVRLLLAEPGDIQEYKVSGLNTATGSVQQFITTDKRFYEVEKGKCYILRSSGKDRVYFGGKC